MNKQVDILSPRNFTSQTRPRLPGCSSQQPGASHTAHGRSSEDSNVARVAHVNCVHHVAHANCVNCVHLVARGNDNEHHLWVERVDVLGSKDGVVDELDEDDSEGEHQMRQAHPVLPRCNLDHLVCLFHLVAWLITCFAAASITWSHRQ